MVIPGSTTPASNGNRGNAEVAMGGMSENFLSGM
jgi:hypothetical protein